MMISIETLLFLTIGKMIKKSGCSVCNDSAFHIETMASLYKLSKKHDLAHIVAAALFKENILPDGELGEEYKKEHMLAIYRTERLWDETKRVCELFEENGIPHIPLKGAVLRNYYPEPWMRTSCDVDILVEETDLQRASDLLVEKLDYTLDSRLSHDWGFITRDGFHIELHFNFIEQDVASDGRVSHTWTTDCLDNIWQLVLVDEGKEYSYHMSDELFYFYHIAHMAKHFERGGCGVRPLIDLWILNHKVEHDQEKREQILEENGLLTFAKAMTDLSEDWFCKGICRSELEHISEYILCGGVYGNSANSSAVRQNKNGSKLRYFLSMVFLPYYSMKLQYPILEKHKCLLPVCYVCRIFRTIFFRTKKIPRTVKSINSLSSEKLLETQKMMRDLGLS